MSERQTPPLPNACPQNIETLWAVMLERDRRMEERFKAQQTALEVSARSLESYKMTANEFRGALVDANNRFMGS
jgi:hypothetical protein